MWPKIEAEAERFDFVLSSVNVPLDWHLFLNAPGPRGRLHAVGALVDPIPAEAFALIMAHRSISGTPLGGPATTAAMLGFCARHGIEPITQTDPLDRVNEAIRHARDGRARDRVVLEA